MASHMVNVRRGSSPLARGLRHSHSSTSSDVGIIPARAGFTWSTCTGSRAWTDHPRSRGVYRSRKPSRPMRTGSSPLARGLRDRARVRADGGRIIPARAGFTALPPSDHPAPGDHPRSRGVYVAPVTGPPPPRGSSPLARGLPGSRSEPRSGARDHPRSRGVYRGVYGLVVTVRGSSPLARGLHRDVDGAQGSPGIIPARAGFTRASGISCRARSDHPRSRGVYGRPARSHR